MSQINNIELKLFELVDQIAKLRKEIDELKRETEENKPTPPHPRWNPNKGENYYWVSSGGGGVFVGTWSGDSSDGFAYSIGNVAADRDTAAFKLERLKVLAEMREWAGRWNDAYVINYDSVSDDITYSCTLGYISYGEMRFATREDAENCIKAVGEDRIKKYYFMIPEE